MDDLETHIRKFYFYSGVIKGIVFTAVGIAFVPRPIPLAMIIFAGVALSLLIVFVEVVTIYPRDMGWHRTLARECRDQYERRLIDAVADMGYFGIYRRSWIAQTYDELYWKPMKAKNKGKKR